MKSLTQYILEGQIDGLKNVSIIRHYTTGSALKSILNKGYIEARESPGDDDWKDYDLFDKRVVSFHDKRTDPEWNSFIDANKKGVSMNGLTNTLALHMDKVCACIEIDYDKLPQLIQDKTHLLNIYGKKAKDFCNLWNFVIKDVDGDNAFYNVKLELINLVKKANAKGNEELHDSLKYIWGRIKYKDSKAQTAWKIIEDIFKKYYPNKDLYEEIDTYNMSYRKDPFIVDVCERCMDNISYRYPEDVNSTDFLDKVNETKKFLNFFNRTNLKPFTDEDTTELAEYAIKFDVINVIKTLAKHGWRFGDYNMGTMFLGIGRGNDGKLYDGTLIYWIEKLSKNKDRIINANIEVRIPSNVNLTKDNCKIIIFDGICDATKQSSLKNLPKKYYDKYNIEHIK